MTASLGNLAALQGLSFSSDEYTDLSVQSYTLAGSVLDDTETVATLDATTTGTNPFTGLASSFQIIAVNSDSNTISVNVLEDGTPVTSLNLTVIAVSADAILVSGDTSNTIAGLLNAGDVALASDEISAFTLPALSAGAGVDFSATGSFTASAPCFLAGTHIMTPGREVPVEALAVGDRVVTLSGEAKPIAWIGMGRVLVTPGRRSAATPIIVRRGALADNVPSRDLHITKGHSLYLDSVLIPAEFLINYRSILWDDRAQVVEFYHIELATHDVLLADGALAETYRDDGNRRLFQNANSGWSEPPKPPCAPVLTGGPIVDALWRRLLDRAGPRPAGPLTDEPDLHLLVDSRRVDASRYPGGLYTFRLPPCPTEVRLASRAASPTELGLARDPRLLGVAVRQIRLWQGARLRLLEAADPALEKGFHGFEPDEGLRWTDGSALLPLAFFTGIDGSSELEVLTCGAMHYPLTADEAKLIAA